MSDASLAKVPTTKIYSLSIERFRGITSLHWQPARGVNIILGGGDAGKTTSLEAITLLVGTRASNSTSRLPSPAHRRPPRARSK